MRIFENNPGVNMQPRTALLVVAMALGALCLVAASGCANPQRSPDRTPDIHIDGYRVDISRATREQVARTLPTLEGQVGMIGSVALPREVQAFFRTVPIVMDPGLSGSNGRYAQSGGRWVVLVRPGQWPADRAILLHELLHAYHREVLRMPAPQIGAAYEEARRMDVYPQEFRDAYFLSNPREYFAVIGEVYLAGRTFRPPYDCATVQKAQPAFIVFMSGLFGTRECAG